MDTLPYLTATLPGVGGELKSIPEDFYVEEIPLYPASGEGPHIYVTFEKKGLTTFKVINRFAEALGINPRQIGYAGLKDAHAVTRQTISIENVSVKAVENVIVPGVTLISAIPHRNKLKVGHLSGNHFAIKIRGVTSDTFEQAQAILDILARQGVPNYFGEQRFGLRNNTHKLGLALIQKDYAAFLSEYLGQPHPAENPQVQQARTLFDEGDWAGALDIWPKMLMAEQNVLRKLVASGEPKTALYALDKRLKRLFVSAYQSHLFNQLLAQRLETINRLEAGDVAFIHRNRACFVVESVLAEQPRADNFEISPAGPLFGPKYLLAQGEPAQREQALLQATGIQAKDFDVPGTNLRGGRRPYRIPLGMPTLSAQADGLLVTFTLPPGAYATMVLREIMKNDLPFGEEA